MRFRTGVSGGITAVMLIAGTAAAGAALATPPPVSARPTTADWPARAVTLVTGDRVTVSGDGVSVAAEAGPGRDGVTFTVIREGRRVRVIPSDVGSLLSAGRLDARLFDVTGLLEAGYDRRDYLPLIVTGGKGATAAATRQSVASAGGLGVVRDLPTVRGVAVRQPRGKAAESWRGLTGGVSGGRSLRSGVGRVWLDGLRKPTLDVSVPQIGAPTAWQEGYTGAGSTVAVLDSGVDDTHPDLAGQVVGRQNFTDGFEPDSDLSGHGTHVGATIAGTGDGSDGKYQGVAPGAKLLDGKVCVASGCAESWIVAGMTWAAAERHAKVVNLSLGGADDPTVVDPVEEAVQTLSDQYGTLFVIAAGNTDGGVVRGEIDSPGTAEAALTVGAVDDHDALAGFSRRGPGAPGERVKPEITAPGVSITAARGKVATVVPGNPGDRYTTLSGTSMATPHVAGAAAILAGQHSDWSGQQLKAALMASAKPNPTYGVYDQGAGRVDVARAVGATVTGSPASVSFGKQLWPHQDDPVLTRDVTYQNHGPAEVTLALALDTRDPDGTPAPVGMLTVSAASVRVPAGGTATVMVTADTRVSGPDGYFGGWLTATAGDQVVRTPIGMNKEVESYDVTLTHVDRAGGMPSFFYRVLTKRDSDALPYAWFGPDPDATVVLRVPAGHYSVMSRVSSGSSGPTLLAQPDLDVDRPMTVNLDARLGRPVSVAVAGFAARQVFSELATYTRQSHGTNGIAVLGTSFENMYTARIGPDIRNDDQFLSVVAGQWAQADAHDSTDNSPYLYTLFFPERGQMMNGYQRSVTDSELAKVSADFALAQPHTFGTKRIRTGLTGFDVGNFGPELRFRLPFSRIEYYNTDVGLGSAGDFTEWIPTASGGDVLSYVMAPSNTEYQAGGTYRERWNTGVFGPALPPTDFMWLGATRTGDALSVEMPLFGDGAGRPGDAQTTSHSVTLYRNGAEIADSWGVVDVPADEASYRLTAHAERGGAFALSTKVDVAWDFRSGHVAGATPVALSLWSIRFAPDLDRANTVPANEVHKVPVIVTPQPGAQTGQLVGRTVEASFDDGATWVPVPVDDDAALVRTPAGSGFVSLRATAADTDGNTVKQTIIRAYRYDQR